MAQTVAGDRVGENRLINRELSSLDFYARVLDLASDPNVPLLERVRFSSIFSLHMDEFFMVRVGGLRGQEDAGVSTRSADGRTPRRPSRRSASARSSSSRGSRSSGSASSGLRWPRRGSWSRRSRTATRTRRPSSDAGSSVRSFRC